MNIRALLTGQGITKVQTTAQPPVRTTYQGQQAPAAEAYGRDGYVRNGQPTGAIRATSVTFLQQQPYASGQLVSLLRLAHEANHGGDKAMATSAYNRATYLARSTDEFVLIAQHAAARQFHTVAKDALFSGKGRTNDVNQLLRLAETSAGLNYTATTNDLYQTATASSHNFYQLTAIARHAEARGYHDAARAANFKAISIAG
jgi:hypothetical protein